MWNEKNEGKENHQITTKKFIFKYIYIIRQSQPRHVFFVSSIISRSLSLFLSVSISPWLCYYLQSTVTVTVSGLALLLLFAVRFSLLHCQTHTRAHTRTRTDTRILMQKRRLPSSFSTLLMFQCHASYVVYCCCHCDDCFAELHNTSHTATDTDAHAHIAIHIHRRLRYS